MSGAVRNALIGRGLRSQERGLGALNLCDRSRLGAERGFWPVLYHHDMHPLAIAPLPPTYALG